MCLVGKIQRNPRDYLSIYGSRTAVMT